MRRRRGFTLAEVMIASAVLGLVAAGTVALMAGAIRGYNRTTARSDISLDVSQSLQYLARDLQEAKDVTLVQTYHLRIFFPQRNADGSYTRAITDTTNTIEYYRANASGASSSTGAFMVRKIGTGTPRRICAGVTRLEFESDSAGSVNVSLAASGSSGASFQMIHRAIFMRNN
jgi:prepilin-type N-terminal cleavage/methylation domain-containing protein